MHIHQLFTSISASPSTSCCPYTSISSHLRDSCFSLPAAAWRSENRLHRHVVSQHWPMQCTWWFAARSKIHIKLRQQAISISSNQARCPSGCHDAMERRICHQDVSRLLGIPLTNAVCLYCQPPLCGVIQCVQAWQGALETAPGALPLCRCAGNQGEHQQNQLH